MTKTAFQQVQNPEFFHVFYKSPLPTILVDLNTGIILDINEQFTVLSGYTKSELVGYKASGFNSITAKARREWYKETNQNQSVVNFELRFKTKQKKEKRS